jgi:anti-sigma factor RsiW
MSSYHSPKSVHSTNAPDGYEDEGMAFEQLLLSRLFRSQCPSTEELIAFQQGLAPSDQRMRIGEHLHTCPHCAREFRMVEAMLVTSAVPVLTP